MQSLPRSLHKPSTTTASCSSEGGGEYCPGCHGHSTGVSSRVSANQPRLTTKTFLQCKCQNLISSCVSACPTNNTFEIRINKSSICIMILAGELPQRVREGELLRSPWHRCFLRAGGREGERQLPTSLFHGSNTTTTSISGAHILSQTNKMSNYAIFSVAEMRLWSRRYAKFRRGAAEG